MMGRSRSCSGQLTWMGCAALMLFLSGCGAVRFTTNAAGQNHIECEEGAGNDCSLSPVSPSPVPAIPVSESIRSSLTDKVDVLFVVDSSGSMDTERAQLGSRLANFTSGLSGLDWQICVTTTDPYAQRGDLLRFNVPSNNSPSQRVLTAATVNFDRRFLDRVVGVPGGTGDEQGIHALNLAVGLNHADCFRRDAALAAIVLSDEDERSVGGYPEYASDAQFKPLLEVNKPQALIDKIRATWGQQKIFTAHSIVVRTGDKACYDSQTASASGGRPPTARGMRSFRASRAG